MIHAFKFLFPIANIRIKRQLNENLTATQYSFMPKKKERKKKKQPGARLFCLKWSLKKQNANKEIMACFINY